MYSDQFAMSAGLLTNPRLRSWPRSTEVRQGPSDHGENGEEDAARYRLGSSQKSVGAGSISTDTTLSGRGFRSLMVRRRGSAGSR